MMSVVNECSETRRREVLNNPDKDYLTAYGIAVDEVEDAIKEADILKPYRLYVLKQVADLLTKLGVSWFITDGTLLGWYRNKSMISHDTDIDTIIMEKDMLCIWKNRHLLPNDLEMKCNDPGSDDLSFQWCSDDRCIPFDPSKHTGAKQLLVKMKDLPLSMPEDRKVFWWVAHVDLYTCRLEDDGYHLNDQRWHYPLGIKAFPESCFLPVQKAKFEEIDVFVPRNPLQYLELQYGYIGENAVFDEATKLYKPLTKKP